MSVKRKIDSDDFIKGLKSAFAPIKEAVEPIGKEIKEINNKFTNTVKKELKPVIDKFETKFVPSIDKVKDAYSDVKEYVKSEEGQKEILNNMVEYAKAYREKYSEYFALEEQVKKSYPNARVSFDIDRDEFISKVGLNDYKTVEVKTRDSEFKVRYYPKTGKVKIIEPKKDEGSWFQAGAFEDGYQFGDITKTAVGTAKDLSEEVIEGVLKIGEGVVDTGATVSGVVGGWFGADDYKDKVEKFVAKDIIDEEALSKHAVNIGTGGLGYGFDYLVGDEDNASLLGEKSEGLANSAGQLAGQIGLQSVGVPWWVTTGATSFGSGTELALQQGANLDEAALYGTIQAGADILTEKLFGGSGLGEKGLIKVDGITKGVSNKVAKAILDYGIDIATEGGEEVFAKIITDIGEKFTYNKDKEITLKTLFDEEALDNFISGVVLGSVANTGKVVSSVKQGTDYRTGLTDNEQKVFDKVYKEAIGDAETGGRKLAGKEKAKIYDEVLEKFKKGDVSSESIEAALGGEEYRTYKNALRDYTVLQKELSEIESIDKNVKTKEQTTRQIQLRKELSELKNKAVEIKQDLQNKVLEKIDVDNISLKKRESYLGSGYNKEIQDVANEDLYKVKQSQKMDEKAFVDGLWGKDEKPTHNDSAENVESSQLDLFDNYDNNWYNTNDIITDGSHLYNGELKANVKYKSGEYDYIYATDEIGRISDLHTDKLQYTERDERLKHNSNTPGKEEGDHAGHLIGDRYGGSPDIDNVVSQSALVNLSEYKRIENIWAKALNNGQKVSVDIKVQYEGNSMRPSGFIISFTIDGTNTKKIIQN